MGHAEAIFASLERLSAEIALDGYERLDPHMHETFKRQGLEG
jgi:hypothetical protein